MTREGRLFSKRQSRKRRQSRVREHILERSGGRPRLVVTRSLKHMRAQVIAQPAGTVIASASTLDADVLKKIEKADIVEGCNQTRSAKSITAAQVVGQVIAERCLAKNVTDVVFDRNGFLYHGRVKAVADGARAGGLKF